MWYVIQTETGREEKTKNMIMQIVSPEVFRDCRILFYESMRRYLGEWHTEKKRLFPGYLFIDTDHVEELFLELKHVPELTKLLGYGGEIIPLKPEEERLIRELTQNDDTATMSVGIQVGDKIIVKEGVLAGKESIIRKVDRHKRKALIEIEMLGEKRPVEIGLEIIEKNKSGSLEEESRM